MSLKTAPQYERPVFDLRMKANDEDADGFFYYRGRLLRVTLLPDEDLHSPSGGEHEIALTDAQEAAWDKGEWWYHHLIIQAVDGLELTYLEPAKVTFGRYEGRLPSFQDHTDLVFSICDQICDRMDAAGM
jgi:hypothetical protein